MFEEEKKTISVCAYGPVLTYIPSGTNLRLP